MYNVYMYVICICICSMARPDLGGRPRGKVLDGRQPARAAPRRARKSLTFREIPYKGE